MMLVAPKVASVLRAVHLSHPSRCRMLQGNCRETVKVQGVENLKRKANGKQTLFCVSSCMGYVPLIAIAVLMSAFRPSEGHV